MANISLLSRLVSGVQRQVDLSTNTLVVSDLQINGINLRNASTGTEGSRGIGDFNSYTNFTPAAATIKGALSGIDTALGTATATSALDGTFRIKNTADPTKQLAFSAAGISPATTHTITMPNADVDLGNLTNSNIAAAAAIAYSKLATLAGSTNSVLIQNGSGYVSASGILSTNLFLADGSVTGTGAFNLGGFTPTNSGTPVNPNDLVNKSYVDNFINATSWKTAVLVATTANITLSGEQTIDGFLTSASRVLVKNQSTASQNGIYVSAAGSWTRSLDMDAWSEVPAAAVFVQEGTINGDIGFVCVAQPGGTLGSTAINFVQFSSAGAYTADNVTLQLLSGIFSIKNAGVTETQLANSALSTTGALNGGNGTKLSVRVDASSVIINGSNNLAIGPAGITAAMLGAVTDGTTTNQGGAGGTIRVANAGVSATQLATGAFDQLTITGGAGTTASVARAPAVGTPEIAGEALSATTLVALRFAKAADAGFVAGRMYKADYDSTTVDNFFVIGLAFPAGSVSTGGSVTVIEQGLINVPSHGFTVGQPLYLSAAGAITATAPSTTLQAVVRVGMVKDANNIWVQVAVMGIN